MVAKGERSSEMLPSGKKGGKEREGAEVECVD
jgi:hypothetical protein